MDSTGKTSLQDELGRMKAEVCENLRKSSEKANSSMSRLFIDVRGWSSENAAIFRAMPAGKCIESSCKTIGRNLQMWRDDSVEMVTSRVSSVRKDFDTLRENVRRNVQTLTSGDVAPIYSVLPSALSSSASSATSFPTSTKEVLEGADSPLESGQAWMQPQPSPQNSMFASSSTASSASEGISEEEVQSNQSVSATSVFSIGALGSPLLTDPEKYDEAFMPAGQGLDPGPTVEAPFLKLEHIRKSIGKALIIYKKFRSLGLRESSWENKMPWRKPEPAYLAKGLRWPQEKFSSLEERRKYHKRMRRRGRYLIGPTPDWSWFAADVIFLYILINNNSSTFLM